MEYAKINRSFGGLASSDDRHSVELINIKYNHYNEDFEAKILLKSSELVDLKKLELESDKFNFEIKDTKEESDITMTPPSALTQSLFTDNMPKYLDQDY